MPAKEKNKDSHDTVYMSVDIVESTRLISDLKVESARDLLEQGLQLIADVAWLHGGSIIYSAGDGAVAEFKKTAALSLSLLQAIAAGLEIQTRQKKLSLPYTFRIGIDAVQTDGIESERVDYAFATLVQEHAPSGTTALSERCFHLLEQGIQQQTTPHPVSNNSHTMMIYLINDLPASTRKALPKKPGRSLNPALKKKEEAAGEIKLISSLFVHVEETVHQLTSSQLKTYLEKVKEIIKDYGATLIKASSSSIMVVVGAPIAYEDHATRACLIAQRILKISENMALSNQAQIGIHSGPAVVDDIGSEYFHQYDALGSAVSFAARLQQMASPGQVLVSEQTVYLAGDAIRVQKIAQKTVKGFKGQQSIYLLENVVRTFISQKLEWDFYSQQIFIDHVAEIQMFRDKLAQVVSEQTVIWGINAEPGVGKSRLSYEFSKIAEEKGFHLLTISALSYQKDLSFSLLQQFFSFVFNLEMSDPVKKQKQIIVNGLKKYESMPQHAKSALFAVFSFETDADWQRLVQKEQLRLISVCMLEIIRFHARNKPLFLTIDDMHWCDSQSLAILQQVCAVLSSERIIILMCFRPEFHGAGQLFQRQETLLMPLSIHDSHDLMNHLLYGNDQLEVIKEKIIQQSDGNPFYMEEITRYLINSNILIKKDNKYQLQSTKLDYNIPDTIQGVISGSIDRLSPKNKQLLQQASILGFIFSLSDLQLLSDLDNQTMAMHLTALQEMGLVFTKELFPHTQYSFKHAYILDVTYQMMLTKHRIKYHEKLVYALENLTESSTRVADLAYHSFQANLWLKSFQYYVKIIPRQINIEFPINRILKDSKQAELAYQQLSRKEQEQYFDEYGYIKLHQIHAILASGRPDLAIGPFQMLEQDAKAKNNPWIQSLALAHLMVLHILLNALFPMENAYDRLPELCTSVLRKKKNIDKKNYIASIYFPRALHDYIYADYEAMFANVETMIANIPIANTSSLWLGYPVWNVCRLCAVMGLIEQGRLTPKNSFLNEFIPAVTDHPISESTAGNHWALAMIYFDFGELENAKKHCLRGLEDCEQIDFIMFTPVYFSYLAFINMLQGEHDKAVQHAKKSYELSKMLGHMFFGIISMARVAHVLLNYNHFDLTRTLLDECLPLADKAGQKCRCIELYQVQADYLIAINDAPQNKVLQPLLQKTDALIDQIGANHFYPLVQRSYARLYQKQQRREEAEGAWKKVFAYFDDHPNTFWRDYFLQEYKKH